jgi:predicted small lipoprotein YifL
MHSSKALGAVPGARAIPLRRAALYGARTSETLMRLLLPASGRALAVAGLIVLALAACGRRGAPEAPLTAAEAAAQQQRQQTQAAAADDDEDEFGGTRVATPLPSAPRRRSRAYTIPQEPFILDPLL